MVDLWFLIPPMAICIPPKCGGTSLYRRLFDVPADVDDRHVFSHIYPQANFISRYKTEPYTTKILVTRDPVERFASLWRDKCRNGDDNLPQLRGMSPEHLLVHIDRNLWEDAHWAPQSAYFVPGCSLVPYGQVLSWFGVDKISNYTERKSDDPRMPIAEIAHLYRQDMQMIYGNDPDNRHF